MNTLKFCFGCSKNLPTARFSRNVRKKDGLDSYCKPCTSARSTAWARKNPERRKAQAADQRARNPGKAAAYCKAWREANPGAQQASERRWYEKNRETVLEKDRQQRLANIEDFRRRERESYSRNVVARHLRNRAWREANPAAIAAYAAERRAAKALRTPPWLDDGHRLVIGWMYEAAQLLTEKTGVLHHVDHIVPLRGKTVSGLHVPWNLQCLPWRENLSKNNRVLV
ncbi:MAG TPA: HNH endonuclease signature motif containing protein [Burkholderiaceae bacterium]|nr:HNH endonuclease signature motif containing protein [Burkholderiaceae bacterium]